MSSSSNSTQVNYPSECPMHESNQQDNNTVPVSKTQTSYPSECPMNENYQAPKADDKIDPTNMMPPPNQRPSPDQPFDLSTTRVSSSIPKAQPTGEHDKTWQYPSPQMFWNAMIRKGWRWQDDEPEADTINNIINIHNVNNERAWREVLMWESYGGHTDDCPLNQIKLKKFSGKAKDFSWKAKIRGWMGYPMPFDRHDWVISRCGKERTYVIDYYDSDNIDEETYQFSILDVRPHPRNGITDLNGDVIGYWPEGMWDRTRATIERNWDSLLRSTGLRSDHMLTPEYLDQLKAVKKDETPAAASVNVHKPNNDAPQTTKDS